MTTWSPWWWKIGIPADIWVKFPEVVKETIDHHKLAKVSPGIVTPIEAHMGVAHALEGAKVATEARLSFPNIRGGMKTPHLHYGGEIFLLNEEQWKEFSSKVMKKVVAKLSAAKSVSFQQLVEVSEAVNTLA